MGSESGDDTINEDYTQYIPRGYYTASDALTKYFKAMMWYGRMTFLASNDDQTKSAALITAALDGDSEILDEWERVYTITSFFTGSSDDAGYYEYKPLLKAAYGRVPDAAELAGSRPGIQRQPRRGQLRCIITGVCILADGFLLAC